MSSVVLPRQPVVYRIYDEAGELLYVGMSGNLSRRLFAHFALRAEWADDAHRVEWDEYPDRAAAREAEAQMIFDMNPLHNQMRRDPAPADGRSRWARRRDRIRGGPPRQLKPHGTVPAARRHQRAIKAARDAGREPTPEEELCGPCRAAWAEHQAAMYRQRRDRSRDE